MACVKRYSPVEEFPMLCQNGQKNQRQQRCDVFSLGPFKDKESHDNGRNKYYNKYSSPYAMHSPIQCNDVIMVAT